MFKTAEADINLFLMIKTNENWYLPGERGTKLTTDKEVPLKNNPETFSPTILESIKLSLSNFSLVSPTDSSTAVS